MMPWENAWLVLSATFASLISRVTEIYPTLRGAQARSLEPAGGTRFHHSVHCSYDFANCEWVDLSISLSCAPYSYFQHGDGSGLSRRDAIGVEIERGNGKRLAVLDPMLLPEDDSSVEYEAQVMAYVARAQVFVEDQLPLIVEALREPFCP